MTNATAVKNTATPIQPATPRCTDRKLLSAAIRTQAQAGPGAAAPQCTAGSRQRAITWTCRLDGAQVAPCSPRVVQVATRAATMAPAVELGCVHPTILLQAASSVQPTRYILPNARRLWPLATLAAVSARQYAGGRRLHPVFGWQYIELH